MKLKEDKKIITIFILIVVIIIILILMNFESIKKYFTYDIINTLILAFTLITTIICFNKGKKNDIIIHKKIRDQENFESEIDKILSFYPLIVQEFIDSLFDYNEKHIEQDENNKENCVFKISSLDRYNSLIAKYICEITSINNRIMYLYKYHHVSHPEFDKFKIKVIDMNNTISNELSNLSTLMKEFITCYKLVYAESLINKRSMCLNNIVKVYNDNISYLYLLADNCIEERANISIKYQS